MKLLIVGAGPTGLGAAWNCSRRGCDSWLLVESTRRPGGLAGSFVDPAGFTWDVGGHVQFSHYEVFDRVMDELLGADGWYLHQRNAAVWIRGRFVPYPLQNHLHHLPDADVEACLEGLRAAPTDLRDAPASFEDWIRGRFGDGLCDLFLRPYNFKVWAHSATAMDWRWVGERVATAPAAELEERTRERRDDPQWGPNRTFRFPRRGGTGAIWSACAARLPPERLRYGVTLVDIDLARHVAHFGDGSTVRFDHLLSTLPLTRLLDFQGVDPQRRLPREGLLHASTHVVGVGLRGRTPDHLLGRTWMYFPESDCPFYRATLFSAYSPANVPDPSRHWSLMTETSSSPEKSVDPRHLAQATLEGLRQTGLVPDRSRVVSVWQHHVEHGYPVPGRGRDSTLAVVIPWLDDHGVCSRGRFGGWKYEVSNQDHAFMQGVELVDRIYDGVEEVTYFRPDRVNAQRRPPLAEGAAAR